MKKKNTIYDLNLLDRFLFAQAVEDIEFVELILSIILDTDITLRDYPQPEREQSKRLTSKQIKLDVMATDVDDNVYDTEVQKKNTNNLPKRMRYYHSLIDSKLLQAGERDYNKLNDVFVIIIAPFDLFGKGLYRYTFRMECEESPGMTLGDGTTTIFLNTRGTDRTGVSDELVELLEYFENSAFGSSTRQQSDRLQTIRKKVDDIRRSEEVGVKYMLEWEEREEWKDEARAEGLKEGRAKGRTEGRQEGLKEGRQDGLKEGRQEGLKEGRQEGLKEGRQEGLKEGIEEGRDKERIRFIKAMHESGMSEELIGSCTGLTVNEIKTILKQEKGTSV